MSEHATIKLQADAQPILNCLQDIKGSLSGFEVLKVPLEILDSFFNLGSFALKQRCINFDTGATGAVEILVALEPSESLLMLAAALRTQKVEGLVIEQ